MTDEQREGAATADAEEPRTQAGDVLEVSVERIVPGGAGMAHARGLTVFVPLAAPGDVLRVRVERVKGRVAFASLAEIVAPGRERVEPPCPYFGRCGGCDFQQLAYEAQLAAKVEIIRDCLRRIARIAPPAEIPIAPSPSVWRYRSRARWQHDTRNNHLGYYELASHRVIDVAECPVVVPELQETLSRLRASVVERSTDAEAAREFEAVAGDDGVSLSPPLAEEDTRERARVIAGERYSFDASCFFQINHALLDALVREALREEGGGAEPEGGRGGSAVDLYCGVGLFTLPLARRFARVTGVEANPAATAYARRNLSDAGLANGRVETAPVGAWLARRAHGLAPVDLLLLDPPRAGAEHGAVGGMLALRPRRIVYVSCDPATLARDLRELIAGGYLLDSVSAFDMFPQTHHVETVARLTRAE
ncbi:MAG: class I SAM-dependent RNA methyltransferase [Acidobacteria bacterium]|nr:class I SAM-dependent RNA methyltransferase [Acidobacteriota bacterium]MCA1643046.1 class I SAM-dependent RNA methyltransferase [Acidobacteriota bacterium]